jgi:hypothetical protein
MNDSMDDRPIDFSPLDPTTVAVRFDAVTSGIVRDAMESRARRALAPRDVFAQIASWTRPALIAAAVVLTVSIPPLVRARREAPTRASVASATDVLGIPRSLMDLLQSSRTPSLLQIDQALASADGTGR